jgi:hypothetical protein
MPKDMVLGAVLTVTFLASAQNILSDSGKAGPDIEIAHLCYDEWPTGTAVAADGRKFSNHLPALDPTEQSYTI